MPKVDLDALEAARRHLAFTEHAVHITNAIAELRSLRARPVSCEACNGMAKRIEVLIEECEAGRAFAPNEVAWSVENDHGRARAVRVLGVAHMSDKSERLVAARLATDENGGLGA